MSICSYFNNLLVKNGLTNVDNLDNGIKLSINIS